MGIVIYRINVVSSKFRVGGGELLQQSARAIEMPNTKAIATRPYIAVRTLAQGEENLTFIKVAPYAHRRTNTKAVVGGTP